MTEKKYTAELADLHYKEGILFVKYRAGEITLPQAKVFIAVVAQEFGEILPARLLFDISAIKSPKKEVRDYLGSGELDKYTKASAIIANSVIEKILGNLFLTFTRPKWPTKIFTDETAALAWLQQIK